MFIVCLIVNSFKVVIVDELIGNFDLEILWEIMDIFEEINKCGMIILMVMYNCEIVNIIWKCVIVIENGNVVCDEVRGEYGYEG